MLKINWLVLKYPSFPMILKEVGFNEETNFTWTYPYNNKIHFYLLFGLNYWMICFKLILDKYNDLFSSSYDQNALLLSFTFFNSFQIL